MSHHPNCFCEECRGDNPMPTACDRCGFVHHVESSCAVEIELKCTCYETRGQQCAIHPRCKHGTSMDKDCIACDEERTPIQAEKEPIDDMGLLSKYKPRDNNGVKSFKRRDFLKKEHFPKSGELSATIIELRDAFEGSFSDLLLDVKCGREEYTVGIKFDSVLLDQIVSELGQDEKRWRGKQVVFELVKGKYINLQREGKKAGASARKRSKSKR